MSSPLFSIIQYINYLWKAQSAHGLHSPFVFDLYNQVINKKDYVLNKHIKERYNLINAKNYPIEYVDPKNGHQYRSSTRKLQRKSGSRLRFSRFLIQLVNHLNYNIVLETGSLLGTNAAILELSNAHHIYSIEGSSQLADLATKRIKQLQLRKVEIIQERVQDAFIGIVEKHHPDMIFLDADHRSETILEQVTSIMGHSPTTSCIVIHDIYWSKDMMMAWQKIVKNASIPLTIDLFQAGIIFPLHPIEKQHFILCF